MLFSIWPWQAAAKHLLLLALLGTTVAELCLLGTQKLPFTCSYLPGKSNVNITFLLCLNLGFLAIVKAALMERDSFDNASGYTSAVGLLTALAVAARWSVTKLAASSEAELHFEESAELAVLALNLPRPVE
jgi:hypothetical protein